MIFPFAVFNIFRTFPVERFELCIYEEIALKEFSPKNLELFLLNRFTRQVLGARVDL